MLKLNVLGVMGNLQPIECAIFKGRRLAPCPGCGVGTLWPTWTSTVDAAPNVVVSDCGRLSDTDKASGCHCHHAFVAVSWRQLGLGSIAHHLDPRFTVKAPPKVKEK